MSSSFMSKAGAYTPTMLVDCWQFVWKILACDSFYDIYCPAPGCCHFWSLFRPLSCYLMLFPFKWQKSPIDPHYGLPLLCLSVCLSLIRPLTHRQAAPLKAAEKKTAAFVQLLWRLADISEVGSRRWLGATEALVSWHYPPPKMLPSPAAVSAFVCVYVSFILFFFDQK